MLFFITVITFSRLLVFTRGTTFLLKLWVTFPSRIRWLRCSFETSDLVHPLQTWSLTPDCCGMGLFNLWGPSRLRFSNGNLVFVALASLAGCRMLFDESTKAMQTYCYNTTTLTLNVCQWLMDLMEGIRSDSALHFHSVRTSELPAVHSHVLRHSVPTVCPTLSSNLSSLNLDTKIYPELVTLQSSSSYWSRHLWFSHYTPWVSIVLLFQGFFFRPVSC